MRKRVREGICPETGEVHRFPEFTCEGCDCTIEFNHSWIEKSHDRHFCIDCAWRLRLVSDWEDMAAHGVVHSGYMPVLNADREIEIVRKSLEKNPLKSRNLTKAKRFFILNRDGFSCRYCGASPGKAELHVDHVVPKSRGGNDEEDNLVTACVSCNLGKSDSNLFEPRI